VQLLSYRLSVNAVPVIALGTLLLGMACTGGAAAPHSNAVAGTPAIGAYRRTYYPTYTGAKRCSRSGASVDSQCHASPDGQADRTD